MKLYVYNHCPHCIKARLVADISGLKYETVYLANDDEKAHIDKIGSKQVPFLELDYGTFIKESRDVCEYIAKIQNFKIEGASDNTYLANKLNGLADHNRKVIYPRMPHNTKNACDFPTQSAKEYFLDKKALYIGDMSDLLINPPNDSITAINETLASIDSQVQFPFINGDKLSWDDVYLFPILFILTMAKEIIVIPTNIKKYIHNIEKNTNIELY